MNRSILHSLLASVVLGLVASVALAQTPGVKQCIYGTANIGNPLSNAANETVPGALFACIGPHYNKWAAKTYTVNGKTYNMVWVGYVWAYAGYWPMKGGVEYHFARQYGHGGGLSFKLVSPSGKTVLSLPLEGGLATASFTPETDGWYEVHIAVTPDAGGYNCGPSVEPFTTVEAGLLWNEEPGVVDCTTDNIGSWKKFLNTDEETFLYTSTPPAFSIATDTPYYGQENDSVGSRLYDLEIGSTYSFSVPKVVTNATFTALLKATGWTLTLADGEQLSGTGNSVTIDFSDRYVDATLQWEWSAFESLSPGFYYGKSGSKDDWSFTPSSSVVSSTGIAFAGYKEWAGIAYDGQGLDIGTCAYACWMYLNKGCHFNISRSFNDYCRVLITPPGSDLSTALANPSDTYIPTKSGFHKLDIRFTNGDYSSVGCNVAPYSTAKRALVWNIDGPTEVTAENITTEWYRFANADFEVPLFWAEIPPEIGGAAGTVLYIY